MLQKRQTYKPVHDRLLVSACFRSVLFDSLSPDESMNLSQWWSPFFSLHSQPLFNENKPLNGEEWETRIQMCSPTGASDLLLVTYCSLLILLGFAASQRKILFTSSVFVLDLLPVSFSSDRLNILSSFVAFFDNERSVLMKLGCNAALLKRYLE